MLTMTQEAGAHLAKLLEQAHAQCDTAVRLVADTQRLSLSLDTPRPGDVALACAGRTVLLLDEKASRSLAQCRLDVEASADGPQLLVL